MPFRGSLGVGVLRGGEANQFGRILGGGVVCWMVEMVGDVDDHWGNLEQGFVEFF